MRQCLQFVTTFSILRIIETLYFAEPAMKLPLIKHAYKCGI